MKIFALILCLITVACAPYKPDLDATQVVDGQSIIVPPHFDDLPKEN